MSIFVVVQTLDSDYHIVITTKGCGTVEETALFLAKDFTFESRYEIFFL